MKDKSLYIIIIGCGKLGANLANHFSKSNHSVVIIDKNSKKFSKLSIDFSGFKLEEDALEEDVLMNAKINNADVMICATHDDDTNTMVALIAKVIHETPVVIARNYEPSKESILKNRGVYVISPLNITLGNYKNIINSYGRQLEE